ncbi:hypothetical protein [Novipirellula maiorica]|nr:hypothetical protein [Rhodopirellula maiorica]
MMMRVCGAEKDTSDCAPDIEVRFKSKSLPTVSWRHLGEHDAVHADERFAIETADVASPIEFDLQNVFSDGPIRITLPSGTGGRIPLLRSIINSRCVDKQILGLHGSAFTLGDHGYMVCGWPRGGKTGVMLAYLLQGAEYLAAEWVYVAADGQTMHGVPEPIRLRDWHLRQGASQLKQVRLKDKFRLTSWKHAAGVATVAAQVSGRVLPKIAKSARKLAASVDRNRYIDRPAADWLGQDLRPRSASLDTILLAGTHDRSEICVTPLTAEVAKRRLIALHDEDLDDLRKAVRRWSYAIADMSDCVGAFEQKRDVLFDRLLQDKQVYAVDHPHNANLADLYQTLQSNRKESCLLSL